MAKKLNTSEAILGTEAREKDQEKQSTKKDNEQKLLQTSIYIRRATKEDISELAWRKRTSFSGLINQICEEYLEKHHKELE